MTNERKFVLHCGIIRTNIEKLQKHKEEKELNTSIGIMQIPHGKLDFSINQIETTLND